jgi:hypothetical protein
MPALPYTTVSTNIRLNNLQQQLVIVRLAALFQAVLRSRAIVGVEAVFAQTGDNRRFSPFASPTRPYASHE